MSKNSYSSEHYLKLNPYDDYELVSYVGAGKIGKVYRAESKHTGLVRAFKIIPEGGLKDGWQKELEKVRALQGVPHVVQYHGHGAALDKNNRPYLWVMLDFIDGGNLKDIVATPDFQLTVPFIETVLKAALEVLYACSVVKITHGDLHAGNILIAKPDKRILNGKQTVYLSDFGYGGSHNHVQPKDDFRELAIVVLYLLGRLPQSELNPRDRSLHSLLQEFAKKRIMDTGRTAKLSAGALQTEFDDLTRKGERQSAIGASEEDQEDKTPADYLWAEALGTRGKDWKSLFVPDLLISSPTGQVGNLLAKTITVLTGARGCGKTMSFRRLTKLMDEIIGERLNIPGIGTFVGFYLNCRDLTDAFPWVPNELHPGGEQQVIHFFHLAWLAEICKSLAAIDPDENGNYQWLEEFFVALYGSNYPKSAAEEKVIAHVRSFIEAEKEKTRLVPIKKASEGWLLARLDLLDTFFGKLSSNVAWLAKLPAYLFLDDYTIPIVPRAIQLALNPIIFRRRSALFFKVSTEATNSFVPTGLRKKPLELHHDFALIDLATESLHQTEAEREKLLDLVFRPRIKRHKPFSSLNLGLDDVLGETPYSNNELAWQMRNDSQSGERKKIHYHGKQVFVGLWTSDIRTMVEMLNDMLREANGKLTEQIPKISEEVQNRCIRNQGGEMMTFTQSIRDYELWKQTSGKKDRVEKFGNHLKSIVEAFISVSRYELIEGKLVGNQGRDNPKQAFRIEIVDSFQPDKKVRGFLEGLIRYHIFLQDWRGKSQRGMITPRLYLNRTFLPFGGLTLSSHDHIQLKNEELTQLLEKPSEFLDYWKRKRKEQAARRKTTPDDDSQSKLSM
jgi:hypothetical protein